MRRETVVLGWTVEVRKRVCVFSDDIVFCVDLMTKCIKGNWKCPPTYVNVWRQGGVTAAFYLQFSGQMTFLTQSHQASSWFMMMSDSICAAVTQTSLLDYYYGFVCFFLQKGIPELFTLTDCVVSVLSLLSGHLMYFALSWWKGKEMSLLC